MRCRLAAPFGAHLRRRSRRAAGLHGNAAKLGAAGSSAPAPIPPRRAPAATGRRAGARHRGQRASGSPELPIAISTLRTKRSRPMRLTGEPAKQARKAASSRRASSASGGATRSAARRSFASRRRARELVPRADGEAIVAAIDAVADRGAELARDRALVLDGQVGDAAPRIELVGRREGVGRADVEAARGRSRNGRPPARRAAARRR